MRFQQVLLFLTTLLNACVLASPVPSFEEIERRWLKGESEAQIHANHHIREASPAWLIDREADAEADGFSYSPDKRTLENRRNTALVSERDGKTAYSALKKFVNDFMSREGRGKLVTKRSAMVDEAPVLKPRKVMRYHFSA